MLKTLVFWSLFRLRKMSFQIIHDQKQNCEDLKMTPEISFIKYASTNHKLNTSSVPQNDLWALGNKWDTILPLRISWMCILNNCEFFWDVNNSSFSFWRHSMESTFDFMKIDIIGQISEVNPVNIVRIGNESIHLKEKKSRCQHVNFLFNDACSVMKVFTKILWEGGKGFNHDE